MHSSTCLKKTIKYDAFSHVTFNELKKTIFHSKVKDGVEGADSGRISETIETLQERSDEAAQCEPSGKRAPATQSKSGSFSNHFFSNHFFFITSHSLTLKFTTILCHSSQSHQILKIVAENSFQSAWFFGKVKLSRTPFA
ncbi:hypothetical protein NM897_02780 [Planococcus maritimus]|uniref:hypothetical protein n=1 Tax=Planococcus maritimus TaxID=192421 RepID=UPI0031386F1E